MPASPRLSGAPSQAPRHTDFVAAQRFDAAGDHGSAVQALRRASAAGDVEATTYLASRLLLGRAAPRAPAEAIPLMARAAKAGGAEANLFMANLTALGEGPAQSWPGALRHLRRAAELGSVRAQAQLSFMAGAEGADAGASWAAMARTIDFATWLTPPQGVLLRDDPRLHTAEEFLTERECRWLIERARPLLRPATVVDLRNGQTRADDGRSNSAASFDLLSADLVLLLIQARLAAALHVPVAHFERSQVLHYAPGETFALHHDCLPTPRPASDPGQRVLTALIYLNDDYEGGETHFPSLSLRHRGRAGDAFWFSSVDAAGRPHPTCRHAGLPPTRGEKWVLSQWVRDRAP